MKAGKTPARLAAGPSRQRPQNNAASSSKSAALAPIEKSTSKADITKEKSKIVADKPREKPKQTGKLTFAKAKAKDTQDEPKAEQNKKESSKTASTSSNLKGEEPKSKDEPPKEELKVRRAMHYHPCYVLTVDREVQNANPSRC